MNNFQIAVMVFMCLVVASSYRWYGWGNINRLLEKRHRQGDAFDILEICKVFLTIAVPVMYFQDEPQFMLGHFVALGFAAYYVIKWLLIHSRTGVMFIK